MSPRPVQPGSQPALLSRLAGAPRQSIALRVDGQAIEAFEGDTLLTALLCARDSLRHDTWSGEARAGFCLMGACQDCWIWSEDGRRLRACTTLVEAGMAVRTAAPGLTGSAG